MHGVGGALSTPEQRDGGVPGQRGIASGLLSERLSTPFTAPFAAATEVEAVLFQHPGVHQAAVFGVPNRVMGELVAAAVTLRPEAQVGSDGEGEHRWTPCQASDGSWRPQQ